MLQKRMTDLSPDIAGLTPLVGRAFHAKPFEFCSEGNAEGSGELFL